jgi:hypothetical protein
MAIEIKGDDLLKPAQTLSEECFRISDRLMGSHITGNPPSYDDIQRALLAAQMLGNEIVSRVVAAAEAQGVDVNQLLQRKD